MRIGDIVYFRPNFQKYCLEYEFNISYLYRYEIIKNNLDGSYNIKNLKTNEILDEITEDDLISKEELEVIARIIK
jgi:hypothetical protein